LICNKGTLAEVLRKSPQTITTWQKQGMPILADGTRGAENQYETADVIQWLLDRELGKLKQSSRGDDAEWLDAEQELARLRCAQADKVEIEVALLQGRVLDADEVQLAFGKVDAEVKSSLLSMPSRLAPVLIKIRSVKEMTRALKEDVLQTLAKLTAVDDDGSGPPSGEA
jgi:phage terminase Nu1 subunit (DNA packaging protein)